MRRREYGEGHVICHEGESAESLFVIVDGFARVLREDRPVARLRRGDVIGEMSLVSGEPRSATVVAAVPTTAFELSRYGVAALIAEQPRILENLTRILTDRLAATTARVADSRTRGEAVALVVSDEAAAAVAGCDRRHRGGEPAPRRVRRRPRLARRPGDAGRPAREQRHGRDRRLRGADGRRGGRRPHRHRRRAATGHRLARPPPLPHQARPRARRRRREGLRARRRAARARGRRIHGRLRLRLQHRRDGRRVDRARPRLARDRGDDARVVHERRRSTRSSSSR